MTGGAFVVFVILIIVVSVVARLVAGGFDGGRVRQYIESRGGTLLEKHWNPLGKGWYGEKDSRIYSVRYRDADGNIHEATCKTSMMSGVYFTEDRIVESASALASVIPANTASAKTDTDLRAEIDRLKKENAALAAENKELKNQRPLF